MTRLGLGSIHLKTPLFRGILLSLAWDGFRQHPGLSSGLAGLVEFFLYALHKKDDSLSLGWLIGSGWYLKTSVFQQSILGV